MLASGVGGMLWKPDASLLDINDLGLKYRIVGTRVPAGSKDS